MNKIYIKCLKSEKIESGACHGQFIINSLKSGQGITIGNQLRRVLLGDLGGIAISSVRIAGISHEFSTIPGVREDILEILLNLKEVVLKSYTDQSQIGRVRVQGPAIITSGLFNLPPEIQIIDPRQYIATICNNTIFEMEFIIEYGSGYRLVERGIDNRAIDFLQIDAVFMPTKKFNYTIEEVRITPQLIQEKLFIELWTNGSLSPQEALSQGATILTNLFYPLRKIDFKIIEDTEVKEQQKINQVLIEELQLSVRAYNCLKRAHIHSISDLLDYSQEELLEIKNFGQKSAEEVIEALQNRLGISLPKEKIQE